MHEQAGRYCVVVGWCGIVRRIDVNAGFCVKLNLGLSQQTADKRNRHLMLKC